jgi:hypothetical protein
MTALLTLVLAVLMRVLFGRFDVLAGRSAWSRHSRRVGVAGFLRESRR